MLEDMWLHLLDQDLVTICRGVVQRRLSFEKFQVRFPTEAGTKTFVVLEELLITSVSSRAVKKAAVPYFYLHTEHNKEHYNISFQWINAMRCNWILTDLSDRWRHISSSIITGVLCWGLSWLPPTWNTWSPLWYDKIQELGLKASVA